MSDRDPGRPQAARQSSGRIAHPATAIGWLALATVIVLGRHETVRRVSAPNVAPPLLAPLTPTDPPASATSPAPPPNTITRHPPVVVMSEWWHDPVEVLATPADSAASVSPAWTARLPRPLAALRSFASPLIMPRLRLPRAVGLDFPVLRGLAARARPGQPMPVTLTAYCLHGTTRQGTPTRSGIVAADPRIFPMLRHVHLFAAGRYLGRFRVEDTGGAVHGAHLDIWTPDCADAERFGTRSGVASLVALGD